MVQSQIAPEPGNSFEASLLDQIEAAVIGVDLGRRITQWNTFAGHLFGYSRQEALGQDIGRLLFDAEPGHRLRNAVAEAGHGESTEAELALQHKEGHQILVHARISPFRYHEGSISGAIVVCVDISRRKRAELRMATQYEVTRTLADSPSLDEATPKLLEAVCTSLDFDLAALWEIDPLSEVLRCVDVWQRPGIHATRFEAKTKDLALSRATGLPGRVWATAEPSWVSDIQLETDFPRWSAAAADGFHGAFAFPILLGGHVLGVIETFTREVRDPDAAVVQSMGAVGSQIGQFIERKLVEDAVKRSEARKSSILESALDCIVSMDQHGKVVEFNPAAERTFGFGREEVIGRDLASMIIPPAYQSAHREGLARYLDTGDGPVLGKRLELSATRADGSEFPVELTITRVQGACPPLFTGYIRDIADRKRAESDLSLLLGRERAARAEAERAQERLAFLATASDLLSETLDYNETLNQVAHLAVPQLADWCAIDVLEGENILNVAIAHLDPARVELAQQLQREHPQDPGATRGVPNVLRSGRSELYHEIGEETLIAYAQNDEHLEMIRRLGLRSAMILPLSARGRTFGAITFLSAESGYLYDEDDLSFATDLARRAALAIDNARLYAERSHIARTLQHSLLPPRLPDIPGVEVAARYRPAGRGNEVGGDFFDVFATRDGEWALTIGDVCGKGVGAAAVTGLARHTVRAAAMGEQRPSAVLQILNEAILRADVEERFCTAVYARLQTGTGERKLEVSSGGHPSPLVLRESGGVSPLGCSGMLIGLFPDVELNDCEVTLQPGDAVIFYTDGVVEGRGPEIGEEALKSVLASCVGMDAVSIGETIEEQVVAGQGGDPADDIAVLVLRVI
ncbi:MAG: SpoIIE family protein phosphatase [Actinomycetota bacterium]|nr:SpoIIE family protein phosphatase [Actinomycetota bacterium]